MHGLQTTLWIQAVFRLPLEIPIRHLTDAVSAARPARALMEHDVNLEFQMVHRQ